jgi:hypothetical protein
VRRPVGKDAGAASYRSANSDLLRALDRTIVGDGQLASALTSTGQTAAAGARSMDNLIAKTRSGVAALGSSARSPAGQQELATYMQGQLSKAKGLVQTYTTADSQAAQQYRAIAWPTHLPEIHIDPTPPPPPRPRAPVCYIGTEDGDLAKVCPPDTDTVTYFDKDGNYMSKDLGTGAVTIMHPPGPQDDAPSDYWLPSADADRSICGPRTTTWTYPRDGYLITEQLGPDGKTHIAFRTPLGPLIP